MAGLVSQRQDLLAEAASDIKYLDGTMVGFAILTATLSVSTERVLLEFSVT